MLGRLIASQIASAHGSGRWPARGQALSASFLPRLTPAFAGAGCRLDVLRRQQHYRVPEGAQHARPVVCRAARLQPDPRRRQLGEEPLDLAAPQLAPQYRLFVLVDAMHLKDMLGGIQANSHNRHRTAPLLDCINHSLALSMPSGAVHPNMFAPSRLLENGSRLSPG